MHGVQGRGAEQRHYLARFDGAAFQPVALPPGRLSPDSTHLWVGPAGVWVQVGEVDPDGWVKARLYRRVGDAWKADPVTGTITSSGMADMQARSATEAWAAGCRYNATAQQAEPLALRWNGSTWTPLPPMPDTEHCAVSVAPGADGVVWALTWDSVYRWDGAKWTQITGAPVERNNSRVRLDKDGNPLVTISNAPIYGAAPLMRYTGGTWQRFATPIETWAGSLSVAPSGRIWMSGSTLINSPLLLTSP